MPCICTLPLGLAWAFLSPVFSHFSWGYEPAILRQAMRWLVQVACLSPHCLPMRSVAQFLFATERQMARERQRDQWNQISEVPIILMFGSFSGWLGFFLEFANQGNQAICILNVQYICELGVIWICIFDSLASYCTPLVFYSIKHILWRAS